MSLPIHRVLAVSMVALLSVASTVAATTDDKDGRPSAPAVGDKAPLFTLKLLDKEQSVDLNEVVRRRPLILFFGSYT